MMRAERFGEIRGNLRAHYWIIYREKARDSALPIPVIYFSVGNNIFAANVIAALVYLFFYANLSKTSAL